MNLGPKVIDKLLQPKPWSFLIQRTNTLISTFCNRTDAIDCSVVMPWLSAKQPLDSGGALVRLHRLALGFLYPNDLSRGRIEAGITVIHSKS